MKTIVVLAGSKKGLFLFKSSDRKRWQLRGPFLKGREIHHAVYDRRSGRILATSNAEWSTPEIVWSGNLGKTWNPAKRSPAFPKESGARLERIWHIEPGRLREPKVLYAGVAPAALFRSEDSGATWEEVRSLSQHPTRFRWRPGGGGLSLHSIVVDPTNAQRMFVGISAVGVFRTDDGGQSWQTANRGTRADFLPVKKPEYGQCVHKLLLAGGKPSLLFQQSHCGVYRSANGGVSWEEITKGLPSDFGFPLAIHPRKPETIYVLPLEAEKFRCVPGGRLRVFRSQNGGKSWKALTRGLPQANAFVSVLREGMAVDQCNPAGIYFGTNTGKIFASRDDGDTWQLLADNLPPIYSIAAAEV